MRAFNKEELDQLSKLEIYFYTATKAGYKRATTTEQDRTVVSIYAAATGETLRLDPGCGYCSFKIYKTVGEKFYQDLKKYGKRNQNKVNTKDKVNQKDIKQEDTNNSGTSVGQEGTGSTGEGVGETDSQAKE